MASDGALHVFGPTGRDEQLSAFAEDRRTSSKKTAVALRDVRHLLKAINTCLQELPDARALMQRDVRRAREFYRTMVRLRGWSILKATSPRDGFFIETDTDAQGYENSLTVLSLSRYYQFLAERDEFPDIDPMRMDANKSRLGPAGRRTHSRDATGRVTADTDLMFRTKSSGRIAPNTGDPFFLEKILKAGDEAGWPPCVRALVLAKGRTGGRDFQLRPISVFNWLVLGAGDFIHAPGKYSKGRLEARLRVPSILKHSLIELMNHTYPHLGGYAGLVAIAASPKRHRLKSIFIFSLNGGRPVSYSYVNDGWFRPIIERSGMVADRGDGNDEPRQRWVVGHWLRHEFTNTILERIEATAVSAKDKMIQKLLLAKYLGWKSGEAMLRFYGRWHFNKEVDVFIAAMAEAANDNSLPEMIDHAHDDADFTMEDEQAVERVLGGLYRRAA